MGRLKMEPEKTPKQSEREEKEEYEQKQENVECHNDPRHLKLRNRESFLSIRRV